MNLIAGKTYGFDWFEVRDIGGALLKGVVECSTEEGWIRTLVLDKGKPRLDEDGIPVIETQRLAITLTLRADTPAEVRQTLAACYGIGADYSTAGPVNRPDPDKVAALAAALHAPTA